MSQKQPASSAVRQARLRSGVRTELRIIRATLEELNATVSAALAQHPSYIQKGNQNEQ